MWGVEARRGVRIMATTMLIIHLDRLLPEITIITIDGEYLHVYIQTKYISCIHTKG